MELARLLSLWDCPGKNTRVAISSSRGSSDQRTEPMYSALAGRFFTTEALGNPDVIIFAFNYISMIMLFFLKAATTCLFATDF